MGILTRGSSSGRRAACAPGSAAAGVAAALMGTTPVFMLPVTVWLYRARVGPLGVIGTLLAVAGVAVCFVRGGG